LRLRSGLVGTLIVAGALCGSRSGFAAAATEPIRIEYHAELGCPSADQFSTQVFRRTSSARLATSADLARTFVVTIERRGNSLVGSLVVRQADGTTESREVAGPDCGEVATVLALATALAIDPEASLAPEPEAPRPKAPEPPAPEPPHPEKTSPPPEPAAAAPRAPWIVAIGPTLQGGIAPGIAYGGSAEFGWRPPRGGALSAVSAEFTFLRAPTEPVGSASASFQFVYGKPAVCSAALEWQPESGVAACLGAELGAVTGWGSNIARSTTRSRFWGAADLGLRVHQALGSAWFVELDGSVVFPVTRYEYVFRNPDTSIFIVPSVGASGTLRVGARL
jgi:hypothetical protein